ncbi:hypothetical protein [Bacillus thuringiensis]|uniref:hypothetical protein n=1 Tax=Bacillus thuringiensis TaxID=1428 RepID=UPI000BFD49CE|nr:hypothetical protein [Bacillus thuringiensis]PGM47442.1 hypothetical protein CN937_03985 [Bacillus thuringiensis]
MISLESFGKKLPDIALFAQMRSGKDEVYNILKELGFNVYRLAYGDVMKNMAHLENPNIPREPKPIEFYQEYGKEKRSKDPNVFVNPTLSMLWFQKQLDKSNENERTYVITDVRQPNEYKAAKRAGFKMIKVYASKEVRVARMIANGEEVSKEILEAPTEKYLEDFDFDYILTNNWSRDELKRQVIELVYKLIQEEE